MLLCLILFSRCEFILWLFSMIDSVRLDRIIMLVVVFRLFRYVSSVSR